MGMKYVIHKFTGLPYDTPAADFVISASDKSLVVCIGVMLPYRYADVCSDFHPVCGHLFRRGHCRRCCRLSGYVAHQDLPQHGRSLTFSRQEMDHRHGLPNLLHRCDHPNHLYDHLHHVGWSFCRRSWCWFRKRYRHSLHVRDLP